MKSWEIYESGFGKKKGLGETIALCLICSFAEGRPSLDPRVGQDVKPGVSPYSQGLWYVEVLKRIYVDLLKWIDWALPVGISLHVPSSKPDQSWQPIGYVNVLPMSIVTESLPLRVFAYSLLIQHMREHREWTTFVHLCLCLVANTLVI